MKNKIIKQCWVTIFCCLCVAVVAGSNNLKIFSNIDGLVEEVLSKVEVPSGTNLTLICQVENLKNKRSINGYVAWFIQPRIRSDLEIKALKNSSYLVFNNVNVNEEGLYVCASLKFKIFKILHLLVKQSKSGDLKFSRLTKREVIPGNRLYDLNFTNPYYDNRDLTELTKNLDKIKEDLYKEIQNVNINLPNSDYGYNNNNNYKSYDNNNNYKSYDNNNNYKSYDNNNYISYDNINHGHPNTNSFPTKPVALVFGVLFVVFVVFLIIRFCGYLGQNAATNRNNNRQQNATYNPEVIAPRANRCGHASCSGNYLLNPAGACRFHNNTSPSAPIIFDAMDIERPLTHNSRNPTTQLDLPPTYSSSTHNSTQNLNVDTNGFNARNTGAADNSNLNLPPSYDEAIGHRNDRHNDTASQNHNGDSSSNHNGDNSQTQHGATNGFSGNHDNRGGSGSGN